MLSTLIEAADTKSKRGAIPICPVKQGDLAVMLKKETPPLRAWAKAAGFDGARGSVLLVPGPAGGIEKVLFGLGEGGLRGADMWVWAHLATRLPIGTFRLQARLGAKQATKAALAFALGSYRFDAYQSPAPAPASGRKSKKTKADRAVLIWPEGADHHAVARTVGAMTLVRDLINTPAGDLGPRQLAEEARKVAKKGGATCRVIVGEQLLKKNYPAIHAVGRAAAEDPRLIDITWGSVKHPKVTLVGKGVTFDTGGLDIKPAGGMKLMKKDMGGASAVLGLASLIMAAKLKVRLRVLIPAVENAVGANAMRPLDVVNTRAGITVEIGHTDAEGRVILADALAEASREKPALLIDCATLTGAARVALGSELPALFSNDDRLAGAITGAGREEEDPLWRLPLWPGYRDQVRGKTADLTNAPEGGYGGAITAALFLERFVGADIPWAHIDMMAWNTKSRPGRPEGGEAQAIRALFHVIWDRFGP